MWREREGGREEREDTLIQDIIDVLQTYGATCIEINYDITYRTINSAGC